MPNAAHVSDDAAELSAIIRDAIADLRLRRSAPDLLAALVALVKAWDEFDDCSGPEPFLDDAFEQARAAIAKAAGNVY